MTALLALHEQTSDHIDSYNKWKELKLRMKEGKTINHENQAIIEKEEKYWHRVLEKLITL